MLRAKWTIKALLDFDDAQTHIAHENPAAAHTVAERIHKAISVLCGNPNIGNPSVVEHTRTWAVARTPYLIVYRARGEYLEILRVWHGRQNRQKDSFSDA